ncbi:hypothetical protein CAEBREN_21842 [Caenorhabditis brenneri]|uniref:Uncharacterized protein n=1 Tax=Caenorhabditis brenneri TaxID=135651 RepID=G0PD71_CAEBE|nr:hypothetical protein CAEBREN_21842 [Caenorhabditis brenneri]
MVCNIHSCPDYVEFVPLIDKWVIRGSPIGIHYTAYTSTTEGSNWYNSMKGREGHIIVETPTRGCQCSHDCVILPMPNNAQLEFYITPLIHPVYVSGQQCTMMLNLEIQPKRQFN